MSQKLQPAKHAQKTGGMYKIAFAHGGTLRSSMDVYICWKKTRCHGSIVPNFWDNHEPMEDVRYCLWPVNTCLLCLWRNVSKAEEEHICTVSKQRGRSSGPKHNLTTAFLSFPLSSSRAQAHVQLWRFT